MRERCKRKNKKKKKNIAHRKESRERDSLCLLDNFYCYCNLTHGTFCSGHFKYKKREREASKWREAGKCEIENEKVSLAHTSGEREKEQSRVKHV